MTIRSLIALFALAIGGGACEDALAPEPSAPQILAARPDAAGAGQRVTLLGERFGAQGELDGVFLGEQPVAVEVWRDRELVVRVPEGARPGAVDFVIRGPDRVSAPFPFEVTGAASSEVVRDGAM